MADIEIDDWKGFPYSAAEWMRISEAIGGADDLMKVQIGAVAAVAGDMQKFEDASPEPKRGIDRLLKLSGRIDAIERELADVWIEAEITYGLGTDGALEEIAQLRDGLLRISKVAQMRARQQRPSRSNNPRGDRVILRDRALTEWLSIYEAAHGVARISWNDYTGRREGRVIEYLIACAEPIFERFKIPVTRDAIAGFIKERRASHTAIMPLGVAEDE